MKVIVSGSSGLIGSALTRTLSAGGVHVARLVRTPPHMAETNIYWNPDAGTIDADKLEGADAVIHLAGENIASGRWTAAKKARIRDSRINGTRLISEALVQLKNPPQAFLSASAVGFYGDRGDEELHEDSGPGSDFLATTAVEWETEAARAADFGLAVASLRIGIVLDCEGGALEQMLPPFRLGVGGPLGDGSQWWSWIDRRDLVRMILAALERGWNGAFNATAPHPERQADFARSLGRALGRPAFIPAPAFALNALFGEFATELLTSKRVLPSAAREAGFEWEFGRLDTALADLLG